MWRQTVAKGDVNQGFPEQDVQGQVLRGRKYMIKGGNTRD